VRYWFLDRRIWCDRTAIDVCARRPISPLCFPPHRTWQRRAAQYATRSGTCLPQSIVLTIARQATRSPLSAKSRRPSVGLPRSPLHCERWLVRGNTEVCRLLVDAQRWMGACVMRGETFSPIARRSSQRRVPWPATEHRFTSISARPNMQACRVACLSW